MQCDSVIEDVAKRRKPINKQAALVTSRGFDYEPDKQVSPNDSDTPLAIKKNLEVNQNFTDLTGVRFGRLLVLGFSADKKKKWVCRCDCGKYTLRASKAIKNPENYGDRCDLCRHHAYLIRARIWQNTGKEIDPRDI